MCSLAKQILQNKKDAKGDDLGIPIEDGKGNSVINKPQYFVARAFLLESKDPRYDASSTSRLHLREGVIYRRHQQIEENTGNFYRLTGVGYKVEKQIQILFWMELRKRLPHLNPNYYKIADGLWWDKINGKVIGGSHEDICKKVDEQGSNEIW